MAEKVAKVGIKKQRGYLYFVDRQGDISRAKMARGGQRRRHVGILGEGAHRRSWRALENEGRRLQPIETQVLALHVRSRREGSWRLAGRERHPTDPTDRQRLHAIQRGECAAGNIDSAA